jgi:hypothetical protein
MISKIASSSDARQAIVTLGVNDGDTVVSVLVENYRIRYVALYVCVCVCLWLTNKCGIVSKCMTVNSLECAARVQPASIICV